MKFADFKYANLQGANIIGVDLNDTYLEGATMPDGSIYDDFSNT